MAFFDRTARGFLLSEIVSGMALTFKTMFKPKYTLNYPYEKSVASPASCARRYARPRPSRSRQNLARMAPGVPPATTST
jgi:NADH-quinone oxidoreductase subunit I